MSIQQQEVRRITAPELRARKGKEDGYSAQRQQPSG